MTDCKILMKNKRGELEEYDVVNFAYFVAGRLIRRYGLSPNLRDDVVQDACLSVVKNRDKFERSNAKFVSVAVLCDVIDGIKLRNHLHSKKTKTVAAPDKDSFFERRGFVAGPSEECEARDLLEAAMKRAGIPRETRELLRRYVDDAECFFAREKIAYHTPIHYRFVRDRRKVAKALSEILEVPMPEKRAHPLMRKYSFN